MAESGLEEIQGKTEAVDSNPNIEKEAAIRGFKYACVEKLVKNPDNISRSKAHAPVWSGEPDPKKVISNLDLMEEDGNRVRIRDFADKQGDLTKGELRIIMSDKKRDDDCYELETYVLKENGTDVEKVKSFYDSYHAHIRNDLLGNLQPKEINAIAERINDAKPVPPVKILK
jgi:hypothetical protein